MRVVSTVFAPKIDSLIDDPAARRRHPSIAAGTGRDDRGSGSPRSLRNRQPALLPSIFSLRSRSRRNCYPRCATPARSSSEPMPRRCSATTWPARATCCPPSARPVTHRPSVSPDFLKRTSIIGGCESSVQSLARVAANIADAEGLTAHSLAARGPGRGGLTTTGLPDRREMVVTSSPDLMPSGASSHWVGSGGTSPALTPTEAHCRNVRSGFARDPEQFALAGRLTDLQRRLVESDGVSWIPSRLRRLFARQAEAVTGLYLWGGVGRGKTYLMDLFHETLPPRPGNGGFTSTGSCTACTRTSKISRVAPIR